MKVLLVVFSVVCMLGSAGIVVRGVLGVRDDGWSDVPLLVPATGGGYLDTGKNYYHLGSSRFEGEQVFDRIVSEQWGPNQEHVATRVRSSWACRYYQGQTPAYCIAGPGAYFPNGKAAPEGALWFPRSFHVGDGVEWRPMDGAP